MLAAPILAATLLLALVGSAVAGSKSYTWYNWVGGDKQSSNWTSNYPGTHTFGKISCADNNVNYNGYTFTVEVKRNNSFSPDTSLGVKTYTCNSTYESKGYSSGSAGNHYFKFPTVQTGSGGITGNANVYYPT